MGLGEFMSFPRDAQWACVELRFEPGPEQSGYLPGTVPCSFITLHWFTESEYPGKTPLPRANDKATIFTCMWPSHLCDM
jgi:hypothetical protein